MRQKDIKSKRALVSKTETWVQEMWNQVLQELQAIEGVEQPTCLEQPPQGLVLGELGHYEACDTCQWFGPNQWTLFYLYLQSSVAKSSFICRFFISFNVKVRGQSLLYYTKSRKNMHNALQVYVCHQTCVRCVGCCLPWTEPWRVWNL